LRFWINEVFVLVKRERKMMMYVASELGWWMVNKPGYIKNI